MKLAIKLATIAAIAIVSQSCVSPGYSSKGGTVYASAPVAPVQLGFALSVNNQQAMYGGGGGGYCPPPRRPMPSGGGYCPPPRGQRPPQYGYQQPPRRPMPRRIDDRYNQRPYCPPGYAGGGYNRRPPQPRPRYNGGGGGGAWNPTGSMLPSYGQARAMW